MRTIGLCLVAVWLLAFAGPVTATNWVRVGDDPYYIDAETAVQNGDVLLYWEVTVDSAGYKRLCNYWVELNKPPFAHLKRGFLYNSDNQLLNEIIRPHGFTVQPDGGMDQAMKLALTYAGSGEFGDDIPALP